ncbi:hypothetical protein LTR62_007269 [Meristemomyces frigidus]|uniref:Uncharacterized protein n=1 Tax=Meristemomyces frigidus TaxID=1508187 RepID=A0AAN7TBY8_9PEZI|nr:hypothetical protein LTR62_007269 [Meristemomyces frigidus]
MRESSDQMRSRSSSVIGGALPIRTASRTSSREVSEGRSLPRGDTKQNILNDVACTAAGERSSNPTFDWHDFLSERPALQHQQQQQHLEYNWDREATHYPQQEGVPGFEKSEQSLLSRQLSRVLRKGMNKGKARLPRRASTSTHTEPVQPVSPSKRTHNLPGPEAKKSRPAHPRPAPVRSILSSSDRKDTPAPLSSATSGIAPSPTDARPGTGALPFPVGGESARAAAAAHRQQPQSNTEDVMMTPEEEAEELASDLAREQELDTRREQVGSLSSAADSGADLSREECKEGVMEDVDMEYFTNTQKPGPVGIDFTQASILPAELVLAIFEYFDAEELEAAQQVNERWNYWAHRQSVWRLAYLRRYGRKIYSDPAPILVGGAGTGREGEPVNQRWEDMYAARVELDKNWRRGIEKAGKAVYLSGHTDSVYCLQFDEEKIITGSRDRTIRVWDIDTYQCVRVIGGPDVIPIHGPKVLRTVDYPSFHLATASVNGTTYGSNIYHTPKYWHDASILCLQYDDEILVTGSSDSDLIIWDIKTYEPITRLKKHTGGVLDVALDAKHIVSCSKDSRIIIWNRKNFEYIGELTGHRGPVNAVQLRGNLLVSASGDGIARMWNIKQMVLVQEFTAKERGLAAVEFSEDMQSVLAGGNDHITYKFDVATKREVQQYVGHTQLVRSLWLDSANARVVSGSYDLDLRVYDFNTGAEIWRAEEWTTSWMLAAKSDYRKIVATSQDGRILVVDFGLRKGGLEDGQKIENIDLLRAKPSANEIVFRAVNWN